MSNVSNIEKKFTINTEALNNLSINRSSSSELNSISNVNSEEAEVDIESMIYDMGNFIDDILNAIAMNLGGNLTRNIGLECFKHSNLENIPDKSEIEKVYLSGPSGEYINVELKSGECYRFEIVNNEIKLEAYLDANGIYLNRYTDIDFNDVASIVNSNDGSITINTSDGFSFVYRLENGEYVISSVTINESILQFHSDITEADINNVRRMLGSSWIEGTTVNGYTTHTVNTANGARIYKIYWIGDTTSYDDFIINSRYVFEALDSYPENVISYLNNSMFDGFIYGSRDDITFPLLSWDAFASGSDYVYFNSNVDLEIVFHELGHIIDNLFGNGVYNSSNDETLMELYEEYKQSIQPLGEAYNSVGYPEGIPNVKEFFAQLSAVYFINGVELQRLLPECYDYIKNFYDNL